ncbi:MAG: two-component regulator propeller domain-containing protein, partial [Bacteroidota bacterium]
STLPIDNRRANFHFAELKGSLIVFSRTGYGFAFDSTRAAFRSIEEQPLFPRLSDLCTLGDSILLAATAKGMYSLRFGEKVTPQRKAIFLSVPCKDIALDQQNQRIWLSLVDGGLGYANITDGVIGEVSFLEEVAEQNIINLSLDSRHILWVGTYTDLTVIQELPIQPLFGEVTPHFIHWISEDDKGQVYYSDFNYFVKVKETEGALEPEIIYEEKNGYCGPISAHFGEIWGFNSRGQWIRRTKEGEIIVRPVSETDSSVIPSTGFSKEGMWFHQVSEKYPRRIKMNGDIITYHEAAEVTAMSINQAGEVYFSSPRNDAYLFRYDPDRDTFLNVSHPLPDVKEPLKEILDLTCVGNDSVFIISKSGLICWTPDTAYRVPLGRFTDMEVYAAEMDRDGYLWIGNHAGLHRYKDGQWQTYDDNAGLPSNLIGYKALYFDHKNRLWIGTAKGLAMMPNPTQTKLSPAPQLMEFSVNGKPQSTSKRIQAGSILFFLF